MNKNKWIACLMGSILFGPFAVCCFFFPLSYALLLATTIFIAIEVPAIFVGGSLANLFRIRKVPARIGLSVFLEIVLLAFFVASWFVLEMWERGVFQRYPPSATGIAGIQILMLVLEILNIVVFFYRLKRKRPPLPAPDPAAAHQTTWSGPDR